MSAILKITTREIGRAVRESSGSGPGMASEYFALSYLLGHGLPQIEYKIGLVASFTPEVFADLAAHLGTPATMPAVMAELQRRAANLMTRRFGETRIRRIPTSAL